MKDIVERLRNWRAVHLTQLRYLLESAADEIERLRLSASGDCPVSDNAASWDKVFLRQNTTTLTSQERDVLREVCRVYADEDDVGCNEIAFVIDRLLSRAGTNGETVGEHAAKCTVASAKLPDRERVAADKIEPVAWVAFATDGSESRYVSASQEQAQSIADEYNWCIAPLFAGLTAEEREAVAWAAAIEPEPSGRWTKAQEAAWNQRAATLRGLLNRQGGGA